MCPCLLPLDEALQKAGYKEVFRGIAWTKRSREWAYYAVVLNMKSVRSFFSFPDTIIDHVHLGTHDGAESGFICTLHDDGVMGENPAAITSKAKTFDPTVSAKSSHRS